MKLYFLDTSALVKAFVPEPGTTVVRTTLEEARAEPTSARVFVSRLAYPECMSALVRRQYEGSVSELAGRRARAELVESFRHPYDVFHVLTPEAETIDHAAALVARHRLRGFDAVHLATALALRHATAADSFTLLSADLKLNAAAQAEKLVVHPSLM